jgi:alpha-beta hydrolase superfamily lysophospholipase
MTDKEDFFIPGPIGRLAVRAKGMADQPSQVVVMVQGSNLTGQTMFDFSAPGVEDYSVMDALVTQGFGTVTFSLRGYGASDAPEDGFRVTTEAAMEDLGSVMDWLKTRGYARPHLLGFSWGGRVAGRWAEANADRIDRLVLYDPARGGGNLVLPAPTNPWWTNKAEHYAEKMDPRFTDPVLGRALGDLVDQQESRSPNGIRLENATPFTAVDPTRITNPTLLIYGVEAAKANYMQGGIERADFFEQLATDDKAFVILPGGDDFIHYQRGRFRFYKALGDFLRA